MVVPQRRLWSILAALSVAVVVAMPTAAQAAPKWFFNSRVQEPREPMIYIGKLEWKNSELKTIACKYFLAGSAWDESEKGLQSTVGFATWECEASLPCEVTNEQGVTKEGTFVSAEGPPSLTTEKARRSGNTSLPWTGELIEKEPEAGKKFKYLLTHHVKLWIVVPLDEKQGGPGKGAGCELLGGDEIPFEEQEGATEKAAGNELAPRFVNGNKNGLTPSHLVFGGEKNEKTEKGPPETGRLEGKQFGPLYAEGELITAGKVDFELVTAE